MYPYWATAKQPPYAHTQAANPYQTPNQNQSQSGNSSSTNQISEAQSSWQPYGHQPGHPSPFGPTQGQASTGTNPTQGQQHTSPWDFDYGGSTPAGSGSEYDQLRSTSSNPHSTPSYPSSATYSNPHSYGSTISTGYYNQLPSSPTPANNYPSSSSLFPKPSENATNTNSNLKTGIAAWEHGEDTLLNRFEECKKGWCCENCKRERAEKYGRPMYCFFCQETTKPVKAED